MTVFRQSVPPYVEGVDVIVQVRDRSGSLVQERRVSREDLWRDVEERYSEVLIDNEKLRLGPYFDGSKNRYFELPLELK